ncbi:magnesium-dependent phosphatase-1 [Rhypophila decipiens]|uniref:Magnesium-dependent phosphatase-1 n=1 Tax=Rhypophila decipiens TaxID=261697 RepID=A0AAN6XYY0_9PEZI|nr:magnesium-dependent phosphatase-1 [Rhypophila decipiens]
MPKKLSKGGRNSFSLEASSSQLSGASQAALPEWARDSLPLPRLIVLDLDYTLWPFYSDIHVATPIKSVPNSNHLALTDRNGERFSLFPDAPHILNLLSHLGIRLAVASKSPVGDLCREMLKTLRLPAQLQHRISDETAAPVKGSSGGGGTKGRKTIEIFDGGLEIYEGTKLRHFEVIGKRMGIPFNEMLFFDDERPNFEVESLGVTMRLVGNKGLSWDELEKGIQKWRVNRGY